MSDLYTRAGSVPAPLPIRFVDDDGEVWTDLAGQLAEGHLSHQQISGWGFVQADPAPDHDPGHRVEWDGAAWVQVALPPAPNPQPLALGKLDFMLLVQHAGGTSDAQLTEASKDPTLESFWVKYQMASEVHRDHPVTAAALAALDGLGYIPNGAAAVIAAWPLQ
ncbi:hypothetical protein [Aurantimonas sp. VKM B-3413]|uniref:hypothetical protein n=1 Tax=Aurantimonas sp. VKM B-3413 TaxID=2779401 RepID=UPI001E56A48C|nr:hypothetical protein [Aurantimonas sp. VKM B-3413]MCB8835928.1 hypothetical protein [Aurantimonas sp. VKM B-3413]